MEKLFEELLKTKIEEIDVKEIAFEIIRTKIEREVSSVIKSLVQSKAEKIVDKEVKEILSGEVIIQDGWTGINEKHDSFEALFKKEFQKKIAMNYDLKRDIARAVESKVAELFELNKKQAIEKVVKEMVETNK